MDNGTFFKMLGCVALAALLLVGMLIIFHQSIQHEITNIRQKSIAAYE